MALSIEGWQDLKERYFFAPARQLLFTPADVSIDYEEVNFTADDGVSLHGWFVRGQTDVTWLWFHGNGGTIGDRVEHLSLYLHRLGVNIFLFDYRGYGRSEGKPTEAGVYRDATGALRYVLSRPDVEGGKLVYFGRSLGGAVATELASRQLPMGLILESTFASGQDMANIWVPWLPLHLLVRSKFRSAARIKGVSCPVLVIHGSLDQVVPISQGRKLYDSAPQGARWLEVEGAGHSDVPEVGGELYLETLREFLSVLKPAPQ